jgi:hypothetical protein
MRTGYITFAAVLCVASSLVQPASAQSAANCQKLSDTYAIVAGKGFGFSPAIARTYWVSQGCNTNPFPSNVVALCRRMSDDWQRRFTSEVQ